MSIENILKEYEKYCKYETEQFKRISVIDDFFSQLDVEKSRNYTIQRMLGASFFVQNLGCEFEDIDRIYESYKNTITKE